METLLFFFLISFCVILTIQFISNFFRLLVGKNLNVFFVIVNCVFTFISWVLTFNIKGFRFTP